MDTILFYSALNKLRQYIMSSKVIENQNALIKAYAKVLQSQDDRQVLSHSEETEKHLFSELEQADEPTFSPIEMNIVSELGLQALLPEVIRAEVNAIIDRPGVSYSVIRTELENYKKLLDGEVRNLNAAVNSLNKFPQIFKSQPEGNEVQFYIPSISIDNYASNYADELSEFIKYITIATEISTGERQQLKLTRMSTGSFFMAVIVTRATLGFVMKIVDWCLEKRHQHLETQHLLEQIRAARLENDVRENALAVLTEKPADLDKEFLEQIVLKEVSESLENERKNELANGSKMLRKYFQKKIDKGAHFGFKIQNSNNDLEDGVESEFQSRSDNGLDNLQRSIHDRYIKLREKKAILESGREKISDKSGKTVDASSSK